jgi:hypothetical protein
MSNQQPPKPADEVEVALDRLENYWQGVSPRRRFRRNVMAISLATSAVVMFGCWQFWPWSGPSNMARDAEIEQEQIEQDGGPSSENDSNSGPDARRGMSPKGMEGAENVVPGEEPKPEPAWRPRTRQDAQRQWLAAIDKSETSLRSAIEHLAGMLDEMTLQIEAKRLSPHRQYVLARMPELISTAEGPEHAAAVELLSELAGPDSVALLAEVMRTDEKARKRLLPTAALHTTSPDLMRAYHVTQRGDEREVILAELARRPGDESMRALLSCIALGGMEAEELAELSRKTPAEGRKRLVEFLKSNDERISWGACLSLAVAADEEQLRTLQQMVLKNHYSHAALITLMLNDSEESQAFVAAVSREQRFAGIVRSAAGAIARRRNALKPIQTRPRPNMS